MSEQENFLASLEQIYDSCLSLIQFWDTRDVNMQLSYGPMIRKLVDIEKILLIIKSEMVEDASYLG